MASKFNIQATIINVHLMDPVTYPASTPAPFSFSKQNPDCVQVFISLMSGSIEAL